MIPIVFFQTRLEELSKFEVAKIQKIVWHSHKDQLFKNSLNTIFSIWLLATKTIKNRRNLFHKITLSPIPTQHRQYSLVLVCPAIGSRFQLSESLPHSSVHRMFYTPQLYHNLCIRR